MLTLGQIQNSTVVKVAGVNPTSQAFINYVNDAARQLIERGTGDARGWWGTVKLITGTAYDRCFVWPSGVIAVLAMESFGRVSRIGNQWYSFVDGDYRHDSWVCGARCRATMEFDGQTCLFQSIANNPTQISVLATSAQDNNSASITIYGLDQNGNEVYDPTLLTRGITLTPGSTSNFFTGATLSRVTDIGKGPTYGPLTLNAYSPTAGIGDTLAIYEGGDVNPKFLYSHLHCRTTGPVSIKALVKFGFRYVYSPNDVIILDSLDAIKAQVQAIKYREAGDYANGAACEAEAIKQLVNQVNSRFPKEQFVVSFKPFGRREPLDNLAMI